MSITSLGFLAFVAVVLAVYYFLSPRQQNYWLLAASYIFCATFAWQFALALAVVTIVNFLLLKRVAPGASRQRLFVWLGIGFNVGLLVFFKQVQFFVPNVERLLANIGVATFAGGIQVLLPVGLSYYMLAAISYLIDVSRKQARAAEDPLDFALYMAYFPKLLAGPIERARVFLPKLAQPRVVDNDALARSFTLIVVGLVRKLVIADPLAALIPPNAFWAPRLDPGQYSAPDLWIWLLAYGFALYNDFAGYTSIVRGVSGLFGLELSPNFQTPYFSRNFTEFWNRWHITLSHWLRDYVFFPLSRSLLRRNPSRRSIVNLVIPPMATMLVSGLWHATWQDKTILLWGGMHGMYQVVERLPSLWRPVVPPDKRPLWRQGLAMALVFLLTLLAWVPFHPGVGLQATFAYWRALFTWTGWGNPDLRVILIVIPALIVDLIQHRARNETVFLRWPRLAQASLLAVATLAILLAVQGDVGVPFVYQGF